MLDAKTGQHISPWIELTGELPTARRLVVPCCVAYGLIPRTDRIGKLVDVAISGILMGYPRQQQGGAVLVCKPNEPNTYYTVHSVRFDESKTCRDAWQLRSSEAKGTRPQLKNPLSQLPKRVRGH